MDPLRVPSVAIVRPRVLLQQVACPFQGGTAKEAAGVEGEDAQGRALSYHCLTKHFEK